VHTVDIAYNPIAALACKEQTRAISFLSSVRVSKLFETFIYFLLGLKGLRQAMLHVPILVYIPFDDRILYHDGVQLANEVLGAKAKLLFQDWDTFDISQRPPRYVPQESEWVWSAEDGGMLNEVLTKLIRKRQSRKEARKQLGAKIFGFAKRVRLKLRLDGGPTTMNTGRMYTTQYGALLRYRNRNTAMRHPNNWMCVLFRARLQHR
jgi:hypothetical protein